MNEKRESTNFEKGMGKILSSAIVIALFSGSLWLSYTVFTAVLK